MAASFKEEELPFVQKAERYCAASEQCITSVRAKLISWGVERTLIEKIIDHLVAKDYVNERRYALAYCETKLRTQKWGKVKIAFQLRAKHLPKPLIDEAIATIDMDVYQEVLRGLAVAKWASYVDGTPAKNRQKLSVFLQSKGFGGEEIMNIVNEVAEEGQ